MIMYKSLSELYSELCIKLRAIAVAEAGITGRIRGMKYKRADGRTVRPTLVVLDGRASRVERAAFRWNSGQITPHFVL